MTPSHSPSSRLELIGEDDSQSLSSHLAAKDGHRFPT